MAQWVKSLFEIHIARPIPCLLTVQFLSNMHSDLSPWVAATHLGDLGGVPTTGVA